ncbi:hypothetical protein J4Q44_G00040030 [Coregonus suidteri]|uniref:Uncharacterized protein n=1 Tax=Coregonus suidteri TaxID=861788 RepID=A0AAN8NCH3_9TELE
MAGSSNKYTVTEALLIVTDESWTCIPIDSESDDEDLLRPDEPDPNDENEGYRVQGPTQASEDEDDYRGMSHSQSICLLSHSFPFLRQSLLFLSLAACLDNALLLPSLGHGLHRSLSPL